MKPKSLHKIVSSMSISIVPCCLVDGYQDFEGNCCLHLCCQRVITVRINGNSIREGMDRNGVMGKSKETVVSQSGSLL
jgi:hypothetical protein